jgi:integrase
MSIKLIAPGKRKRNPFWLARGRVAGRPVEFSTGTTDKNRAEEFAADYVARLLKRGAAPQRLTFSHALDAYMAYRPPSKDDRRRLEKLRNELGGKMVAAIVHSDLVRAADALYPFDKPSSRNRNVIAPCSAILHYAASNGWCEYKRIARFKEPKPVTRAVSTESAKRLLAKAKGDVKLLLVWLFCHGTRITETLSVTWPQIDLRRGVFRIYVSKTDEWRTFPLAQEVRSLLAERKVKEGKVFAWKNRWAAYKALASCVNESGIRFTPHMARHSLGTWMAASGANLRAIMGALGHADAKSSIRYQDADVEMIRAARDGVGKIVGNRRK